MDYLESVIQSEVRQKEKNKYCILTYIYLESRRMVQTVPICGAGIGMQMSRLDLWTQGGEGEGGMN